ncbi:hypothetical protein GHNINEIG_01543 [Hydrogenovibrio crunogenus]|uniref:DUF2920 family protein n=1 Tax=Hydrogenovibrio crunogenus TaxID=39765 RepID=A0A4P7P0F0_9GAMM|nr:DUF2920 family protein [Hydrogenovibrio crunogenus]QBZ83488.1 hypothetical protein GHNINEIG_01543 [Hydrogenovibrio crunogenus]
MSTLEKVSFSTTPDFELGFEHCPRQTDYLIAQPKERAKGLVVYIPGFGDDAGTYREKFCLKVAEKYDLAAMTVDYHCFYSRPEVHSATVYEAEDVALIEKLFLAHNLPFAGDTIEEGVEILNKHLANHNQKASITATLIPGKDEYQNAGVLQALDIINAVAHAIKKYSIPAENVILIGSSYGGYIANLATKFAPKTFRAVFDNSSWAQPHFTYIVGREYGYPELIHKTHSHIATKFFLRTAWTLKKGLPNTFDGKRFYVRTFSEDQLGQFSNYEPETYYYFIHAEKDKLALTEHKIQMATYMIQREMNVHMEVMEAADIDGQYIKTIEHGMNLSMLTFFDKAFAHINDHTISLENDFMNGSLVGYDSGDHRYEFDFSTFPVTGRVTQKAVA